MAIAGFKHLCMIEAVNGEEMRHRDQKKSKKENIFEKIFPTCGAESNGKKS